MTSLFPDLLVRSHKTSDASTSFSVSIPFQLPWPGPLDSAPIGAEHAKRATESARVQDESTVALVGAESAVRAVVRRLIDESSGLCCLPAFDDIDSTATGLRRHGADVLLIDLSLLRRRGTACLRILRQHSPQLKVLILTRGEPGEEILAALRAGANGFIQKGNLEAELLPAIQQAVAGGTPMSDDVTAQVATFFRKQGACHSEIDRLPPRLKQVLEHLAHGLLYKEIADKLGITYDTVNGYVKVIYERLGVHSRAEAAARYLGR